MTCSLSRTHLIRTCFVDFDRSIVLVAEVGQGKEDHHKNILRSVMGSATASDYRWFRTEKR